MPLPQIGATDAAAHHTRSTTFAAVFRPRSPRSPKLASLSFNRRRCTCTYISGVSMRSRLLKLGLAGALASVLVLAVSVHVYSGDPAGYCAANVTPPAMWQIDVSSPLTEANWTWFPVAGASCTWQVGSDLQYGTTAIRGWPTVAMLLGFSVLIATVVSTALSLIKRHRQGRSLKAAAHP